MENVPPSYEAAIARNPWQTIAPYIPSAELCALNRVNRQLHKVFAPCLWGNPASHFGTENDRVYVALTRFKRILKRVRLCVRELTHTLQLPPAQAEIYDGPHSEWLRDVLEQLPNLQSLVVSRLPFFDHMALLALRSHSKGGRASSETSESIFSLRLLIACRCQNTTSHGLIEALDHFQHLAFLDLSDTLAVRDKYVLSKLRRLPLLQVLKLRNVHLRDEDIEILAEAIGLRVRSLDVHGNHLTDHSVRTLLNTCFEAPGTANTSSNRRLHASSNLVVDDWPSGFVRPDFAILDEFKDESYDERFVRRLTSGLISRLPYEDVPSSGITHLYIAENNLTVEGLASLVRSRRLHVLDAGSLNHGTILNRPRLSSSASTTHPHDDNRFVRIPGVEKLIPVLSKSAEEMTWLRIHHAVVTENAPANVEEALTTCELNSQNTARQELEEAIPPPPVELDATLYEMDAAPPLYELGPREPGCRFELPGDSFHLVVSPPIGKKPNLTKDESKPGAQKGAVFAPEVVKQRSDNENDGADDDDTPLVLTATGLGTIAQTVNGLNSSSKKSTEGRTEASFVSQDTTKMQLALILKQRHKLRSDRLNKPHGLIAGMVANLRTLTLIHVPSYSSEPHVVGKIISFIKDCAIETELANLQARLGPDRKRKPGERESKSKHQWHSARDVFALRQIVLEMAPVGQSHSAQGTSFSRNTKSSTEDADSEALWSAAENDFTFFDDDEECGLPSIETDSCIPYPALSEKITMRSNDSPIDKLPALQRREHKEAVIDVVQELAKFRKERKAAYENAVRRGVQHVDGYWPGKVKIVRGNYSGGRTDYFGNRFEKTGLYR